MTRPFGYGSLVSESLSAAWKHRALWLLGALVGHAVAGVAGDFDDWEPTFVEDLDPGVILFLVALGLLAGLASIVLSAVAEGGLVAAGNAHATGLVVRLASAWSAGARTLLPVLGCYIAVVAVSMVLGIVAIGVPIVIAAITHPLVGVLAGLLSGTIALAVLVIGAPLTAYAIRFAVVDRTTFADAWRASFRLVQDDVGRALLVSLLWLFYMIVLSIVGSLLLVLVGVPIALIFLKLPIGLALAALVIVGLPYLFAVRGFAGSAESYYWTLAFLWTRHAAGGKEENERALSDT